MDTAQWPQEIVVKPLEEIVTNTCPKPPSSTHHVGVNGGGIEKKARPQKEQALNCPRCNSTNTKFCYYNNYSLTQPRYFCKTCRRYWTEGGSLRNIPVGGGSRKNKRQSSSSTINPSSFSNDTNNIIISNSSSKTKLPDLVTPPLSTTHHQNPSKIHEGQDLNLAFPSTQGIRNFSDLISLPTTLENTKNSTAATSAATTSCQLSALELLTGISSRGLNSFIPLQIQDPNTVYSTSASTGFISPLQEFKPSLSFSLDGLGTGGGNSGEYGNLQESSGRILFPFEDLRQVPTTTTTSDHLQQNRDHHHHHNNNNQGDSTGYWTGMLGGGSW